MRLLLAKESEMTCSEGGQLGRPLTGESARRGLTSGNISLANFHIAPAIFDGAPG